MTDEQLLDRLIIPPAHLSRLDASTLNMHLAKMEKDFNNDLATLQALEAQAEQEDTPQMEPERPQGTKAAPDGQSQKELTPLETALIKALESKK